MAHHLYSVFKKKQENRICDRFVYWFEKRSREKKSDNKFTSQTQPNKRENNNLNWLNEWNGMEWNENGNRTTKHSNRIKISKKKKKNSAATANKKKECVNEYCKYMVVFTVSCSRHRLLIEMFQNKIPYHIPFWIECDEWLLTMLSHHHHHHYQYIFINIPCDKHYY